MNTKLTIYPIEGKSKNRIPVFEGLQAGFPSPAEDFLEVKIDLNRELVKNPDATFFARVSGNSMTGANIEDGDVLIVDRSLEPKDNRIAVCFIDGEFTVKRLKVELKEVFLMPENEAYSPIRVTADNDFVVWGIVTYIIKKA